MATEPNQSPVSKPVSEQQANRMLANLKALADQWRMKLADPVVQQLVKEGRMVISPLVKELLALFPEPSPGKSTK